MVTNACDYVYKILLLGDCNVGKTCFILRYVDEVPDEPHISTIGVDFRTKLFQINTEEILKVQIWDTAGQDKFKSITKNYFRGANGIILMYDISSKNSFKNIRNWLNQIKDILGDDACVVLVGNKCDLENERIINIEQALILANEYKLSIFESSAKENIYVKETFEYLIKEMLRKYNSNVVDKNEDDRRSEYGSQYNRKRYNSDYLIKSFIQEENNLKSELHFGSRESKKINNNQKISNGGNCC